MASYLALRKFFNYDSDEDQVRKLNENFTLVSQKMSTESTTYQVVQTTVANAGYATTDDIPSMTEIYEALADKLFDDMYPTGSVILTFDEADSRMLNGTWEQLDEGLLYSGTYPLESKTYQMTEVDSGETEEDETGEEAVATAGTVNTVPVYVYQRIS